MTKRVAKAKSDENGLPDWADNELKNAIFQPLDTINRTGYFLDINEQSKKADIQLYESLPDGRTIVEEIEISNDVKTSELMKGFVYEYKIKISKAKLSDQLCELLKTRYQIDMEEIFKFDLESALMMDVESDYNPSNKDDEEDEA
ncbi:MAG TPA: hypothetical protein VJR94_11275 [Candidatus Nitrosocosmicus sp.]|nr:hypothetical protein [Candidatus Nitrosocosmicus sp.]